MPFGSKLARNIRNTYETDVKGTMTVECLQDLEIAIEKTNKI